MKTIGIIPNLKKDINLDSTKEILAWLEKRECRVWISEQVASKIDRMDLKQEVEKIYRKCDFVVVLGGDGTILSVARHAAFHETPILGVNLGTLGFLAEVEKKFALEALQKVLDGAYQIEKRMMLEANILTQSITNETFIALNDVGVTRGSLSRIINLKIYINDEFVDVYSADGIIISTPTGSTAYNLSAGGPILNPNTEMMVITPVCPHSLYSRSIVVSDEDTIKIQIGEDSCCDIMLTMDGQMGYHLKMNDIVVVRKSKYITSLIKTSENGFYDILRKKIVARRK
jgi:NAD+ kinase